MYTYVYLLLTLVAFGEVSRRQIEGKIKKSSGDGRGRLDEGVKGDERKKKSKRERERGRRGGDEDAGRPE